MTRSLTQDLHPSAEELRQYLCSPSTFTEDRANEITEHLEVCPRCNDVLNQENRTPGIVLLSNDLRGEGRASPSETPTRDGQHPTLPPAWALPIKAIPGYELLEELGRGGMGVVYRARQVRLNREVALKMIRGASYAGKEDLSRFRREAEAVARLQHPNIVQVFELGEHDGVPFLSLELVNGGSLALKLGGTPQNPRAAAELVRTLAQAMHTAHQAGIIHRDLKPANLLLTHDGIPKISDFGLAKQLDSAGQTCSGTIMGTPSYMAPEQAQGKSKEMGPTTDVYALGAILYEMLTGRPPFKAESVADTLSQVIRDEPAPPSRLNSKVPRDLETICLKCLHKEQAKRYATAESLADDLTRFLRGEPIHARPPGRVERMVRWARNKPAAAALVVLAMLAIVGAGAALLWFEQRESHLKAHAVRDRLLEADIEAVPAIVSQLAPHRPRVDSLLRDACAEAKASSDSRKQLRASLGLLPVDSGQADYLYGRLLLAPPQEFVVVRDALREHLAQTERMESLWSLLQERQNDHEKRLRAACALALIASQDRRWSPVAADVAALLERQNPLALPVWVDALQPVSGLLLPELARFLEDPERSGTERRTIAVVYAKYAAGRPETLASLEEHLSRIEVKPRVESEPIKKVEGRLTAGNQRQVHTVKLAADAPHRIDLVSKEFAAHLSLEDLAGTVLREDEDSGGDLNCQMVYHANGGDYRVIVSSFYGLGAYTLIVSKVPRREAIDRDAAVVQGQANVAAALLAMGRDEKVWPLLKHQPDPSLRSFLIEEFGAAGPDPRILMARVHDEADASLRRAILLALGNYGPGRLSTAERNDWLPTLRKLYHDDPDPGIHGAAEWLLRRWKVDTKELLAGKVEGERRWYINSAGQTMVVIPGPQEFWMGERNDLHVQRIDRSFAIASKEVTRQQFLEFCNDRKFAGAVEGMKEDNRPADSVSWYEAAAYCNWLSEKEGMKKEQWCYRPNQERKYGKGMRIDSNWRNLGGYRLPTEAEWECSCRAGADTIWSFGQHPELLGRYGWHAGNALYVGGAEGKSHAVGMLKPNDLGLFDMHGNVWEWCQDRASFGSEPKAEKVSQDPYVIDDEQLRVRRGGSYIYPTYALRSTIRYVRLSGPPDANYGFRVARTLAQPRK